MFALVSSGCGSSVRIRLRRSRLLDGRRCWGAVGSSQLNAALHGIVRAHSYRTSRVVIAELALLATTAGAIWVAVVGWPRLDLAEFVVLLGFIQIGPAFSLGALTSCSTILTVRSQRPIVRRGLKSIEIYFPVRMYLIPALSLIILGVSSLSAWFIDPFPFVAPRRVWFMQYAGFIIIFLGVYHGVVKRRVWISQQTARQLRISGFVSERLTRIDKFDSIRIGGNSRVTAIEGGFESGWGSFAERPWSEKSPDPIQLPLAIINNAYDPLSPEDIQAICKTDVSVGCVWYERVVNRAWRIAIYTILRRKGRGDG